MEQNQNLKGTDTPNAGFSSQSVGGAKNQDFLERKVDEFVQDVKSKTVPKASHDPDTIASRTAQTFNSTGKNISPDELK